MNEEHDRDQTAGLSLCGGERKWKKKKRTWDGKGKEKKKGKETEMNKKMNM